MIPEVDVLLIVLLMAPVTFSFVCSVDPLMSVGGTAPSPHPEFHQLVCPKGVRSNRKTRRRREIPPKFLPTS